MSEQETEARSPVENQPMRRVPANPPPLRLRRTNAPSEVRLARVADLLIAFVLIVFTLPLMAFLCLAIRLDSPGPVFHCQPRLGPDGRRFFVLKFRTTVHDADRTSRPVWGWAARETRVGQFLCYTRIEDLPQLVNVLRGEMTLIGTGAKRSIFAD
jgi:lipopolysaccharide/colanic/teichoic acid biosynthesis glycosyltransferase